MLIDEVIDALYPPTNQADFDAWAERCVENAGRLLRLMIEYSEANGVTLIRRDGPIEHEA